MERSKYPGLAAHPARVHLDAAAAFPVHERVVQAVHHAMTDTVASPGKAHYRGTHEVTHRVQWARRRVADFLGVAEDEIFFCASATDAVSTLLRQYTSEYRQILYAPEDHLSTLSALRVCDVPQRQLTYSAHGTYVPSTTLEGASLAVVSHVHHLYGAITCIENIRQAYPQTRILLDISQAVGRMPLSLGHMKIEAAYFSGQKVGGIAGCGVIYIRREAQPQFRHLSQMQPNTLPYVPIMAMATAIDILDEYTPRRRYAYLAETTAEFIHLLQRSSRVVFTKGVAHQDIACAGHGIVSFSVKGYSAKDVAMILDDEGISVRAGDHCVDPRYADRDAVRASWHCYATRDELRRAADVITAL